jgi:hypothetical protein
MKILLYLTTFIFLPNTSNAAIDGTSFINATNTILEEVGAFVGLGTDLRAYESAQPYSSLAGFDLGVSLTLVSLPGKVTNALTNLGASDIPPFLPVPKVNFQKGLGKRLMIGAEFFPGSKITGQKFELFGFDIQWTAIKRPRLPPIALRVQYNYADFSFIRAITYGADVIIGYELLFLNIYGGAGYRISEAHITNNTITTPLLQNVNFDPTVDAGHFMTGFSFTVGFFRLTTEANMTTRGIHSYGTKFSFFF